jgi:hypothetical protein
MNSFVLMAKALIVSASSAAGYGKKHDTFAPTDDESPDESSYADSDWFDCTFCPRNRTRFSPRLVYLERQEEHKADENQ